MSNFLDKLYGNPNEQQGFYDGFEGTVDEKGPFQPLWLSGWKVPIINRELWLKDKIVRVLKNEVAAGWFYEIKRMPKDLKAVFQGLEQEGKARIVMIEHQDEDRPKKDYYQLTGAFERYYVLTHTLNPRGGIPYSVDRQVGIASGAILDYDDKHREYSLYSFLSFPAVSKTLYEGGYVDEEGRPKLILIRFKGKSSEELYDALAPHYNFIKNAREAGLDRRKAQFWAYGVDLRVSIDTKRHGQGKDTTDVYTVENAQWTPAEEGAKTIKNPPYDPDVADDLYCGEELHELLFQLLHEEGTFPPRPGGVAVELCHKICADSKANQEKWNPGNKLKFGSRQPAPAWMVTMNQREEAQRSFGNLAPAREEEGEERPARGQQKQERSDPYQALKETYGPALKKYQQYFNKVDDAKGKAIIKGALAELGDDFNTPEEIEGTVKKALEDARERRAEIKANEGDGYAV